MTGINSINKALVTGATSGIGLEICRLLVCKGLYVCGVGRDFEKPKEELKKLLSNENFCPIKLDLKDRHKIKEEINKIKSGISLVINCAGVGRFGLHEQLSVEDIHEMVAVDIEAPIIITGLMLRELKKNGGRIINISSTSALGASPHGACYGACKAALTSFSKSVFEEARKYGVFVTAVHPDMTRTDFYDKADFKYEEGEEFSLDAAYVAEAVVKIAENPYPVPEVTLLPQKHRIRYKNKKKSD